jgi:F-type H+-transporting ATPase subunit a
MADHGSKELDLFEHAKDSPSFHLFNSPSLPQHIDILPPERVPEWLQWLLPYGFTKFMLLELIVAALIVALVVPVARRLKNGALPKGKWANAVEGLLLFIRDEVARPSIPDEHHHGHGADHGHGHAHLADHDHGTPGKSVTPHEQAREGAGGAYAPPGPDLNPKAHTHRADRYLPLLWTLFLFILGCNLIGMIPFSGSPTGSLAVTAVLSLITFVVIHFSGVANNGAGKYVASFVPHVEGVPGIMKVMIQAGVFAIEFMSLFIRNIVLAVRLFANMVGGHTALFLMLLFIQLIGTAAVTAGPGSAPDWLFWPVAVGSSLLVLAMSMLELFVALLQAYVFTMLTATFIGLAVAPEH